MAEIDDEIAGLTPDDDDKVTQSLTEEAKRIGTLETIVTSFIGAKLKPSADGKGIENTMSSKEIRDITAAQKDIFDMRRKNTGRHE